MKCSELWLREWVNPKLKLNELCNILTMAGLEVEECIPVAKDFSGIYIGQIKSINKHPEADNLHICEVDIGETMPLQVVCGADNVKTNMKVAVAKINAVLPNGQTISPSTIRGIASQAMLCSANELQFSEEKAGIMELPFDAPIGHDLRNYMNLQDYIVDISITPNRGDCLSVRGLAREVSALTETPMQDIVPIPVANQIKDTLSINIEEKKACPRYVGRIIRNVRADAFTPIWMKERLRRSGIRSIHPIVDVTNYVMLELGQPMHAFDLEKIKTGIKVRLAKKNEEIDLLDGSHQELNNETLVIADDKKPVAIAGVMGGLDSSVTLLTKHILLESAYFSPQIIAQQRQFYGLDSDSAYRFERNIDSTIQSLAIERATQLILEIAGGEPGLVMEEKSKTDLPILRQIQVSKQKIKDVLGIEISEQTIETIFSRLNFSFVKENNNMTWKINIPEYRSDIILPEDVIEEIARLYGYDQIPTRLMKAELQVNQAGMQQDLNLIRLGLRDNGLHEIVTYSFISEKLQQLLDPEEKPRVLLNPISPEMAVMRTNLCPGLINTLIYNKSRQQHRVRLFEIGTCFITRDEDILQQSRLAGLITGLVGAEQWGISPRKVDFYDLKGILQAILGLSWSQEMCEYKSVTHHALHPGQTAAVFHQDQKIGILGALHPMVLQALELDDDVFVFELELEKVRKWTPSAFTEVSKYPEIRRDIAILINQAIPVKDIQDTIREVAGYWLKETFIFDLYQGQGIEPGFKSIALGLILQHPTRTLIDEEVAELMDRVIKALKGNLGAQLRS